MQGVDRVMGILRVVADEPGGLVRIAERAGLPVASTARILEALEERAAVNRATDGTYGIGPSIRSLASAPVPRAQLEDAARPEMAMLASTLDEAVCLSIPDGAETLTVLQIDQPKPIIAQDWTGRRWPITGGGSGVVMIATRQDDRIAALLQASKPKERTVLRERIELARADGVAWTEDTYVDGLTSVAAAVVDQEGQAIASIICYGPTYRFPPKRKRKAIESAVLNTAAAISKVLE